MPRQLAMSLILPHDKAPALIFIQLNAREGSSLCCPRIRWPDVPKILSAGAGSRRATTARLGGGGLLLRERSHASEIPPAGTHGESDPRGLNTTFSEAAQLAAPRGSGYVQVFGRRQRRSHHVAAGVRKAPRHEIALGGSAAAEPQARGGAAGTMGIWRCG